jgi:hypothetical protein
MQDMGSDFGPYKLSLDGWRKTPIWADRAACLVSVRIFPYKGATFRTCAFEEGRRFPREPPRRKQALFQTAGFEDVISDRRVSDRVRQIVDRPDVELRLKLFLRLPFLRDDRCRSSRPTDSSPEIHRVGGNFDQHEAEVAS